MTRILFQVGLFLLPLLMFAAYRVATRDARNDRQRMPYLVLLLIGFALSLAFYLYMFFREPHGERTCYSAPRFENGEIISGEVVTCSDASIDSRTDTNPLIPKHED